MERAVFGGVRTTQTMLARKCQHLYPSDTRLVQLSLRDLFTQNGHHNIHDISMQHDLVHYHSASSFFLGTQCKLVGKTIVLEGVPYVRNLHSLLSGLIPTYSHPLRGHSILPNLAQWALDGLSFDDAWYEQYLANLKQLGERNQVYVIHSRADQISLYSDACSIIDHMQCADVCILDVASHHAYHKHPVYTGFIRLIQDRTTK
jgi:hypothetical protein